MNFTPLLNVATIFLSSTALFGILFHDMRIDRAVSTVIGIETPVEQISDGVLRRGHAHTHVHGVDAPLRQSVRPKKDAVQIKKVGARKVHFHFGADNGIVWPST